MMYIELILIITGLLNLMAYLCVVTNSSENRRTVNGGQLYQVNVKIMFI